MRYSFEQQDYRQLNHLFRSNILNVARYFVREMEGVKYITAEHHILIARELMLVYSGVTKRLLMNVPPGFGKTELAVIAFVVLGFILNPASRFIHVSSGDVLVNDNSQRIKDIINHPTYQAINPLEFREDTNNKGHWKTSRGGGFRAAPAGSNIMGFRAGRLNSDEKFSGAIIYDDPNKADDYDSELKKKAVIKRFVATVKTRVAHDSHTPIIVIAQMIAEDDLSNFLLRGGTGDVWTHLDIPAWMDSTHEVYPSEWTHGKPVKYSMPYGPTFKKKLTKKAMRLLKLDPETWFPQYQQRPRLAKKSKRVYHIEHFQFYDYYDSKTNWIVDINGKGESLVSKRVYGDTAFETKKHNDYSVFELWGKGQSGKIYLLDQVRGKWEAHHLEKVFKIFCKRHDYIAGVNSIGIEKRKVEKKASGHGLIQNINNENYPGYIEGIERSADKVSRAKASLKPIYEGNVFLPRNAFWIDDLIEEIEDFKNDMTHRHDDQIDCLNDAVQDFIIDDTDISDSYEAMVEGSEEKEDDEDWIDDNDEDFGASIGASTYLSLMGL